MRGLRVVRNQGGIGGGGKKMRRKVFRITLYGHNILNSEILVLNIRFIVGGDSSNEGTGIRVLKK